MNCVLNMKKTLLVYIFLYTLLVCGAELIVDGTLPVSGVGRFKTITEAVNAMKSGDTVVIMPGEYRENVVIRNFRGDPEKPTVIKAALPQSVVIRGDVNGPIFSKAVACQFTYNAVCRYNIYAVSEVDTFSKLRRVEKRSNLENMRGSYIFEPVFNRLVISTSDGIDPRYHKINVSILKGNGLSIIGSKDAPVENLLVNGLVVTGFHDENDLACGIYGENLKNCRIAGCYIYNNDTGIKITGSTETVIGRCSVYGNTVANIAFSDSGADNRISRSKSYLSSGCGVDADDVVMEESVSFSNANDVRGAWLIDSVAADTLTDKYPIEVLRENFADPDNGDFRPQKDSLIPGGRSYRQNVFFVSPSGDDNNSGLSVKEAWATLRNAKPDSTIYMLPGTYSGDQRIEVARVRVVGRGNGPCAIIAGGRYGLEIAAANVTVERVNFIGQTSGAVAIGGRNCRIKNCGFSDTQAGVIGTNLKNIVISHSAFDKSVGHPVRLSGCTGSMHSNIFMPIIRQIDGVYSNYNSFLVNNIPRDEEYTVRRVPDFVSPLTGDFLLKNPRTFCGRGLTGFPIGQFAVNGVHELQVEDLNVLSVENRVAVSWMVGREDDECEFFYAQGRDSRPDKSVPVIKEKCRRKVLLSNLPSGIYNFEIVVKHSAKTRKFATGGILDENKTKCTRSAKFMVR